MARLFGFDHLRLKKPRRLFVGQVADFTLPPVPVVRRIYAFSLPQGGGPPRCLDFADDEDGHQALARHCRSDNVIRVVVGTEVSVDHSDVVHFTVEKERVMDAIPLMH